MTEEELIQIARYYVDTKTPISKLAKKFGVSKSSIVEHFNRNRQVQLPFKLQKEVDAVKKQNWIDGKSTSGNLGNKKLTDDQIIMLAKLYSMGSFTLLELAKPFNISPATLYNNFTEEILGTDLYKSVKDKYEENKENGRWK